MDLRETYNRIAKDWHKDHQHDDWWIEGTNTFISLLTPEAEILDVGCGGGFKAKYLSERGLHVFGIDFSEKLIEIATREVSQAHFEVRDMRDTTGIDKKFDGIFAQASLLHIPREEIFEVLKGLVSKLAQHGYLYIAVKGVRADKPLEEMKAEDDYGYPYERFFSYFTLDELRQFFTQLELQIVYENNNVVGKTEWLQLIGRR